MAKIENGKGNEAYRRKCNCRLGTLQFSNHQSKFSISVVARCIDLRLNKTCWEGKKENTTEYIPQHAQFIIEMRESSNLRSVQYSSDNQLVTAFECRSVQKSVKRYDNQKLIRFKEGKQPKYSRPVQHTLEKFASDDFVCLSLVNVSVAVAA